MHVNQNGITHPVTMRPHTEDGAQHYVTCVDCGARWAGPYTTRQGAAAVARTMNENPEYRPTRQLRAELCCVEWVPDEDYRDGAVVFVDPAAGPVSPSRTTAGRVVKVLETVLITAWFLASMMRGLVLGALGAGVLVVPLVAVLLVAGGMSAVGISGVDLAIWLGVPIALAAVAVVGWRWTRPRAVRSGEEDYSTPLTTAPGASNVVDVSKTPADRQVPQGVTGAAAGKRHTTQ